VQGAFVIASCIDNTFAVATNGTIKKLDTIILIPSKLWTVRDYVRLEEAFEVPYNPALVVVIPYGQMEETSNSISLLTYMNPRGKE